MDATKDRTDLLRRVADMRLERASWMAHWAELSRFFLPRQGRFIMQDRNRGRRRHNDIQDNTGTRAVRVLGAGMQSGMTSPARPWLKLATPDTELNKSYAVKAWLAKVTEMMLMVFARSNTYNALHQMYEELGVFGTASSVLLDDFETVIHHGVLTIGEYCIAANDRNRVDTLVREFEKPVAAVVKEYGYKNCSQTVRNLYDVGNLGAWIPLIHVIEPRADRDPSSKAARDMRWRSVTFERGADHTNTLRDSGFNEFPALCARWATAGGDIYGGSPGQEALGDVKQLQLEQLRKAQAIDHMTRPPLLLPASWKNSDVDILPGGISYGDNADKARQAVEININLQHLLQDIQDVRQRIKGAFYTDLFLMLSEMGETRMTATEVAERHQEKLLMLGPTTESLHNELLTPLVERTFSRMLRAGMLPPPPEELHGQQLQVTYISMIAQAQRAIGANSIDRYVGNLGQIAAFAPGVLDKFDADQWADVYSDQMGVPPELVVPSDKVALIRQQRAQAQQQAMQSQQAEQQAKAMQALGNTPMDSGNALAALVRGGGLVQTDNPSLR